MMKTLLDGLDQLSWSHPATLPNVDRVCTWVIRFLESNSISREDRFAVEMLLREALTNAVVHGCAENAALMVDGWLRVSNDEVLIEVVDGGGGFDWDRATAEIPEDPTEGGRGMAIYRLYATSYQFNQEGNRIKFRRTLRKGEEHD